VVIDNSSAFRMDEGIPLIVHDVNSLEIFNHNGIIANPNCSTIIMVVAIKPVYDLSPIKRIIVSTYQAVSGAGTKAILELEEQTSKIISQKDDEIECNVFPVQIAFNVIPHIGKFLENGYTIEEMKMLDETRKIFNDYSINISATTVRVPVFTSHSESLNIETRSKITVEQVKKALKNAPGVILKDDFKNCIYPTPLDSSERDEILVGRIREDISKQNCINMWVVGDQLRKGAALNAIQIAEILINKK